MTSPLRSSLVLAALVASALLSAPALAGGPGGKGGPASCTKGGQGGYNGGGKYCGKGGGGFHGSRFGHDVAFGGYGYYEHDSLYARGYIPIPPYFALHPPVYYSLPVPRTYGYSPFPYPGDYPMPELQVMQPATVKNPYADAGPPVPAEANSTTYAPPERTANPFAVADANVPAASLAQAPGR
jgi:hypothetical protein